MQNIWVRVLAALAIAVWVSVAVPVGRNSAMAQRQDWDNFQAWGPTLNWEVADPDGVQVAFDRRDNEGRVYYYVTMVYQGGQRRFGTEAGQKAMRPSYYAADCPKGRFFEYNGRSRTWAEPRRAEEIRGTSPGVGYQYVCEKYGSNQPAQNADSQKQFREALAAFNRGDYATALRLWTLLAEQGLAKAQEKLGGMYYEGRGVARDYAQALAWFRKATDRGDPNAPFYLGVMYHDGLGVAKDYVEAVKWYRKAADQGVAAAQLNLGAAYADGQGVAQDDVEAVRWYRRAAENGWALAQNNLAFMYENGRGVAQDRAQALMWYRKAADQGNTLAQNNLRRRRASRSRSA